MVGMKKRPTFATNRELSNHVRGRRVSQEALAKQLGISRSQLSMRLATLDKPEVTWVAKVLDGCDSIEHGVATA